MTYAKLAYKLYFGLFVFLFFNTIKLNAQIVIGAPSLGFSQACASETFNNYTTTFVFTPAAGLDTSNQFTIELSDPNGDFTNAIDIYTSTAGEITASPATLNFALPITTSGENYRIRIKSNAPIATSSGSANFAAYYKIQDKPFTINNLISTGIYCAGGSYLLTIDNPGTGANDSPLNYPNLTYNWFKETGPTTAIFVADGSSLNVSEAGTFFVETNYGSCTSNSFSNRVTISEVTSTNADAGISSSLGNPFCPGENLTTLSTITGNSYQWYKNGDLINDANEQTYQTNESGNYVVQVDLEDCMAIGEIELISELFEASINVNETNVIEDGETLSVEIITNANTPVFEWYLNGDLLPNNSEDNLDATQFGLYEIVVIETSGCIGSRVLSFVLEEAFDAFPNVEDIPNIVSPNGDGINDTWTIPQQYVEGTNTDVMILNSIGKIVLQTNNYLNDWPQTNLNLNSVNEVFYYIITLSNNDTKKGSITIIK
jgi:gliding motility-associated-like protein